MIYRKLATVAAIAALGLGGAGCVNEPVNAPPPVLPPLTSVPSVPSVAPPIVIPDVPTTTTTQRPTSTTTTPRSTTSTPRSTSSVNITEESGAEEEAEAIYQSELDGLPKSSGESQFQYGCEQGYITGGC